MSKPTREKKAKIWARQPEDWYVELSWTSRRLFDVEDFTGGVLDPCCGRGNILDSAKDAGLEAIGSDIVDRRGGGMAGRDFLHGDYPAEIAMPRVGMVKHIVCNPPFKLSEQFARRALGIVGDGCKVAMIFPTMRLNAAGEWLRHTPLKRVLYLTPRPSMPPGQVYEQLLSVGKTPSGDTKDYCWLVWQRGHVGPWTGGWLHRDKGAHA